MCCIYIGTKASRSSIIWMWFKFPWFVYPSIKIHWKTGIFSYASWAYGALWRQLSKPAILIIIQHINRHIREQTNQLCSWTTWARLAARRPWPRLRSRSLIHPIQSTRASHRWNVHAHDRCARASHVSHRNSKLKFLNVTQKPVLCWFVTGDRYHPVYSM